MHSEDNLGWWFGLRNRWNIRGEGFFNLSILQVPLCWLRTVWSENSQLMLPTRVPQVAYTQCPYLEPAMSWSVPLSLLSSFHSTCFLSILQLFHYTVTFVLLSDFSQFLALIFSSCSFSFYYSQICTLRRSKELKNAFFPQQLGKPTSSLSTGPGFILTDVSNKEILCLSPPLR